MAARDAHLAEVLCFCHGIEQASGHPLSAPGCQSKVTAGTYAAPSNTALEPWQSGGLYSALAAAATSPVERKRWLSHARMLREAHLALRRRPART